MAIVLVNEDIVLRTRWGSRIGLETLHDCISSNRKSLLHGMDSGRTRVSAGSGLNVVKGRAGCPRGINHETELKISLPRWIRWRKACVSEDRIRTQPGCCSRWKRSRCLNGSAPAEMDGMREVLRAEK